MGGAASLSTRDHAAEHRIVTEAMHAADPDGKIVIPVLHSDPMLNTPLCICTSIDEVEIVGHSWAAAPDG